MKLTRWLAVLTFGAALLVGHEAGATDAGIAIGEVLPPPLSFGVDAAVLRDAAEGEIRDMSAALPRRRKVVVSLALTRSAVDPVACTVNAMVRDARTGAMIVIIEALAHSDAPVTTEVRKQVAHAAVRSAVRRIPNALAAK